MAGTALPSLPTMLFLARSKRLMWSRVPDTQHQPARGSLCMGTLSKPCNRPKPYSCWVRTARWSCMKADLMKRVCLQALAMRDTTRRRSWPGRTSSSHSRLSVGLGRRPCCPTAPAGSSLCSALRSRAVREVRMCRPSCIGPTAHASSRACGMAGRPGTVHISPTAATGGCLWAWAGGPAAPLHLQAAGGVRSRVWGSGSCSWGCREMCRRTCSMVGRPGFSNARG